MSARLLLILLILIILNGCNQPLYRVVKKNPAPGLSYSYDVPKYNISYSKDSVAVNNSSFTFTNEQGKEITINEAIMDQESGELIGLRHLNQLTITAKANNIAERNGVITLSFIITVPAMLQNSNWQTEMTPVLSRGADTTHFEKIVVSGKEFKKAQDRGYRRFENYLKSIIPEDVNYLEVYANLPNLAIFLERNLPQSLAIYGTLNDSLETEFGVTEQRIVKQYLKNWLISKNNRKKRARDKKFNKYIKTPYINGARLDSVICNKDGHFEYHYAQDVYTNENSARMKLWISSSIRDVNGTKVELKTSDTIAYSVSSMSGLVQEIERYKIKVTERRVQLNFDANISYPAAKWEIDSKFKNNEAEIDKIDKILYTIISEETYDLDSVHITSFASPEGKYSKNYELSNRRALSIKNHLYWVIDNFSRDLVNLDVANYIPEHNKNLKIDSEKIVTTSIPEDWNNLYSFIERDSVIQNKQFILQAWQIKALDSREEHIKQYRKDYKYIRDSLYPKLRRVSFSLNLLRKGMIKDTTHTTEPDTLYMRGLDLLKKREYVKSLAILNEYKDINTAIAHMSLGHDHTALEILEQATESAKQIYMLAILYARMGLEERAASYFLKSKELDIKMAYRGGLDPEISYLIKKYNLNKDLFE